MSLLQDTILLTRVDSNAVVQLNRQHALDDLNHHSLTDAGSHQRERNERTRTVGAITSQDAKYSGLVRHVYPVSTYLDHAKKGARKIAEKPPVAARRSTQAVDREAIFFFFNEPAPPQISPFSLHAALPN